MCVKIKLGGRGGATRENQRQTNKETKLEEQTSAKEVALSRDPKRT